MKYQKKLFNLLLSATHYRVLSIVFVLLIASPQGISANGDKQSMLELRKITVDFIHTSYPENQKTIVKFLRWDKRINLAKCKSSKIKAFYPAHHRQLGNISIGLRCTAGKSWVIYLRAHISIKQNVVIAKRQIRRGSIISKQDLAIENKEISSSHTRYYSSTKQLIGMLAKREIQRGLSINSKFLKHQKLVKRGTEVIIIASISGLIIRTKGKSLMDGIKGQSIRVKNIRSQKEIQAVVTAANTVKVQM